MRVNFAAAAVLACLLSSGVTEVSAQENFMPRNGEFRHAMDLYDKEMYGQAAAVFGNIAENTGDMTAGGYRVLCAVKLALPGYETMIASYVDRYPYSGLIPQIRYSHGINLFDAGNYREALQVFDLVARKQLYRKQLPEFLFKKAYCTFEMNSYDLALTRFKEVEAMPFSDYTGPSRYSIGYINYLQGNFTEAARWFSKSSKDYRFGAISEYYIFECLFMAKDYAYVSEKGPDMLDKVPEERKSQLLRLISESFLVLGDAEQARVYYDRNSASGAPKEREDFFYAGSVLYAVKDWRGAIDQFSMMTDRTDSLGQIANYNLGYSYVQTKNKVAAMGAFKDASSVLFDKAIAKDAYFNYAKLAFDLNNDSSVFDDYLKRYPDTKRGDRIYSYIAMAALYNRDYAGAVEAYDNIDELDDDMRYNYMKANYLRANQLVSEGAWRGAVPYLKAAAYYSDRRGMFNQLSRFWLAESYYRDNRYSEALAMYTELYNISALYGMEESYLIPYGIAWCHFKQGNYPVAARWFSEYLAGNKTVFRKEALLRKGDCLFIQKDYAGAIPVYVTVLEDYKDINDIYPYYQAGMAYGLSGDDSGKIEVLSQVSGAEPSSAFYPEAMYELGRSYVKTGEEAKAIDCLNEMIGKVTDSTYIARAMIELGMVYRNREETDKALGYYKTVIEKMPLSGYAEDAMLAVESIYQSMNDPDSYLEYMDSIGKGNLKTEDEKEMMIFNAAEQIFLSENYEKALVSLRSYISRYPDGAKASLAEFYVAESYRAIGQLEQAVDHYSAVMRAGSGSFVEMAALNYADLSYRLQRFEDAYAGYSFLSETAQLDDNVYAAMLGMMRSAYAARRWDAAAECAAQVAASPRTGADIVAEAEYIRAKSLLATSRRDEAFGILSRLALAPSTPHGAEAAFMIIQDRYDKALFGEVENLVYDFADKAAGQQYWLAKAFIVLGDSFVERGDYEQAKATFESVMTGYVPDGEDDVYDNVRMRLAKLDEIMKETLEAV